jgi:uncharacterized protein (TIGR02145 family)
MNKAKLTLLTAICIATAFTFTACEEKGKGAEKDCQSKTGPLQTAEATFLSLADEHDIWTAFRLANGKEKHLIVASPDDNVYKAAVDAVYDLRTGDKASITYQEAQYYFSDHSVCIREERLISAKIKERKQYKTVKIGSQTWMAENLNHKTGDARCYGDVESNCEKYGRLYNWNTARRACPSGWHLPNNAEWDALNASVGVSDYEGKHLKAKSGWNENGNGTDSFGFAALPGGYRNAEGNFDGIGYFGNWWSSNDDIGGNAYYRSINYSNPGAYWGQDANFCLFSVRCVQGEAKAEQAEQAEAEKDCPEQKIGSPKTVEAAFGSVMCGDICAVVFLLSNGEKLWLQLGGEVTTEGDERLWFGGKVLDLKEGDKVSITYQKRQYWEGPEPNSRVCNQSDNLESVTVK